MMEKTDVALVLSVNRSLASVCVCLLMLLVFNAQQVFP